MAGINKIGGMSGIAAYGKATVGTSAAALTAQECSAVALKAASDNAGTIYIGGDDSVTSSNGYYLAAGEELTLQVSDVSQIYAIASDAAQGLHYLALARD